MKTLKVLFMLGFILGLAVTANSQDKGNQVERPMKGTFYATVAGSTGPVEELAITGHATHLGNLTGTMFFDKTYLGVDPTTMKLTGVTTYGTLVAANGDQIDFGPDDPGMFITGPGPSGIITGATVLSSGTGRFSDCSGMIWLTGIFNMGEDYASWTADGWIKY